MIMTNAHVFLTQHKVTANSLAENYSLLLGLVLLHLLHCMTLEYAYEGASVSRRITPFQSYIQCFGISIALKLLFPVTRP